MKKLQSNENAKSKATISKQPQLEIRNGLIETYRDIFTAEALRALETMALFNQEQKMLMAKRNERRLKRIKNNEQITFLKPAEEIARTNIKVQDARAGKFVGSEIPADLRRQWVQGTGPATKPN